MEMIYIPLDGYWRWIVWKWHSTLVWVQQRMFCEQWMSFEWMLAEQQIWDTHTQISFFSEIRNIRSYLPNFIIYIYIAWLNDLPSFQFSVTYFNGEKGVPNCGVKLFSLSRELCPAAQRDFNITWTQGVAVKIWWSYFWSNKHSTW